MTEESVTVATKAAETAFVAAVLKRLHKLLPRKQAMWRPSSAKELPAIALTAKKQQQRKQLHKQRQVALQSL